jgi:meiotic recombination protein SPO11
MILPSTICCIFADSIQAKGYPDIQTRQFLHLLSTRYPELPIFALVDFDPDGIGIMSTYKHGSVNLAHESNLAVRSIQWLGVRSCDFLQTERDAQGLLKLTARDRKIALKLLEKQLSDGDWKRELQIMLMLNVKGEIQILGSGEALGEWLDSKLLYISH